MISLSFLKDTSMWSSVVFLLVNPLAVLLISDLEFGSEVDHQPAWIDFLPTIWYGIIPHMIGFVAVRYSTFSIKWDFDKMGLSGFKSLQSGSR